ncbi:MAG: FAD-dependent oxidoreductase [Lachnospiraceae bacterium]|nr:FAD-dependent oxidoreductase [Lachnospiraceae bacterium]
MEENKYDVIVIGAGMAGLLTAFYLQEQGKRVLVIEASEVASGQTGRTTAKITSQHGLKYSRLIETVGVERARIYARANEAAILEYERLIKARRIECGFERVPAYLYTRENSQILKAEARAAALLGIDAFFTTETELPFEVTGAVCFRQQAQFSALAFVEYIAAELDIQTHTQVKGIQGNKVITKDKEFWANKIVVATHYPIKNVPGFYFLRQHQERSYVLVLSDCEKMKGMYLGIDKDGLSLRQSGELLLLGGSSCRTGDNRIGGAYDRLREAAGQYFPKGVEEAHWAAQDCMPHDGIPFIGRYSLFTPNLYVATGFQKWGMTTSMVAAHILRDEICGVRNPYGELFSPQRFYGKAAWGNLMTDIGVSIKGLWKGVVCRKVPRCSHMGCELVWNPEEESWDCPCHGSRFHSEGSLMDNPAKKAMKRDCQNRPL